MPKFVTFNKPWGVLSQFTGEDGQRTLAEFSLPGKIYAAGRLDKDSEGLLILSDDGVFIKKLLDPDNAHKRVYRAQVEGIPTADALRQLQEGIAIRGHQCKPCRAVIIDPQPDVAPRDPPIRVRKAIPTTWIELTLTEGKNRQVRRMTAAAGYPTLRLIRTAIGNLVLGDLEEGTWRDVRKQDIF
ncbi:pseudouridine synthase [Sneathiella sp.]|uniref:pseudouridine synthase n=1 Tax=Sneathiella sp. TaxID=1964365 RepID=UPI00356A98D3